MRLGRAGPSSFPAPLKGQQQFLNVQRQTPVAGWTQPEGPTCAEAGLNLRPGLPCPARLRPAGTRQAHPAPHSHHWGFDSLVPFLAHWPGTRRVMLAMRKSADEAKSSFAASPSFHASCRRRHQRPRHPDTGRLIIRGCGTASGCPFASAGGRRGDDSSNHVQRTDDAIMLIHGSAVAPQAHHNGNGMRSTRVVIAAEAGAAFAIALVVT